MLGYLLIWAALLAGLVFLVQRGQGALTLAYFLALSLGHVPGVLAYLNPNFPYDPQPTQIGFSMTLTGMSAFIVGAVAARILQRRTVPGQVSSQIFSRFKWRVLTLGIIAYFVVLPVSTFVPSLTAVAAAMGGLLIVGIWFWIYSVTTANRSGLFLLTAMVLLLPMATLVTGGFIGYGAVWALSIAAFYFVMARRRAWFYLITPVVIFLGLSLFVTYMQQRDAIRELIWYQNAGIIQRLDQVSNLFTDFQILDLSNQSHLEALEGRLNQNFLVGQGIARHQEGETQLLYGASLPLWALIPRAIWPDKPAVGGGQDLVSEFTGITFDESTSVGAGQVLEFYMNFGTLGVAAGFALFGFIFMRLDEKIMRAFAVGNVRSVVQAALPGLAMVQPLGNLLEILVAVASSIIVSQLLFRLNLIGFQLRTDSLNAKMSRHTTRAIQRR
jgi:hypothetical protein